MWTGAEDVFWTVFVCVRLRLIDLDWTFACGIEVVDEWKFFSSLSYAYTCCHPVELHSLPLCPSCVFCCNRRLSLSLQCLVNENEYIRRVVCGCSELNPSLDRGVSHVVIHNIHSSQEKHSSQEMCMWTIVFLDIVFRS